MRFGILGILLGGWHIIRCNPLMTKAGTHEEVPNTLKIGKFIIQAKQEKQ